jgi:hypothetical protein
MCKTRYSLEKITKDNNNVKKKTFKKIFFPHCCILFEILWLKFTVQKTLSEMEGRRKKEQQQHSALKWQQHLALLRVINVHVLQGLPISSRCGEL